MRVPVHHERTGCLVGYMRVDPPVLPEAGFLMFVHYPSLPTAAAGPMAPLETIKVTVKVARDGNGDLSKLLVAKASQLARFPGFDLA